MTTTNPFESPCDEGVDFSVLFSGNSTLGAEFATIVSAMCSQISDNSDAVGDVAASANGGYMILSAALVFSMQIGFAMLCAGGVRSKNTRNILITNVLDAAVGAIAWYLIGFGIAWGPSTAPSTQLEPWFNQNPKPSKAAKEFIGHSLFAAHQLDHDEFRSGYYGITGYAIWFYQWTFAAAAAGIVSGSVAERTAFVTYLGYTFILTGFVYPVIVHWCWSPEGWLSPFNNKAFYGDAVREPRISHGCIDCAGSGVVHLTGGVAGFWGAFFVGPRIGRFDAEGRVNEMPGHSATLYVLGTFLLWFGWYGFNPGSAGFIAPDPGSVITGRIALVTTLGAGAGGTFALFYHYLIKRQWDLLDVCNGVLCGLVSITSGCSTIEPWAGIIAGIVSVPVFHGFSVLCRKLKVDDPLDAAAMHGGCGMWGVILTGFLATEQNVNQVYGWTEYRGAFYKPNKPSLKNRGRLLGAQLIQIVVIFAWTTGIMAPFFALMRLFKLHRVSEHEEQIGLDVSKHGGSAYNVEQIRGTDDMKGRR